MDQALSNLKASAADIQTKSQQFVQQSVEDAKSIPPIDWALAAGVSFFLNLFLHLATKQKESSFITFGVIVYTLFTAALATILRKQDIREQFPFLVVVFAFVRLFFDIAAISVLVLSASPVLINIVSEEIQKQIKNHQGQ